MLSLIMWKRILVNSGTIYTIPSENSRQTYTLTSLMNVRSKLLIWLINCLGNMENIASKPTNNACLSRLMELSIILDYIRSMKIVWFMDYKVQSLIWAIIFSNNSSLLKELDSININKTIIRLLFMSSINTFLFSARLAALEILSHGKKWTKASWMYKISSLKVWMTLRLISHHLLTSDS